MNRGVLIATLCGAMGALAASATSRAPNFYMLFDENANGQIEYANNLGTWLPWNGYMAPDPTGGIIGANVLIHDLPNEVTSGDIAFFEPGDSTQDLSDVFRFADWNNASHLIFYSIAGPGETSLADTGLPTNLHSPTCVQETRMPNGSAW